jgi:hypothetical protein
LTLRELFHSISTIATIASILPVVVGSIGYKGRPAAFRVLWGWLVFGMALNLGMAVLARLHVKTAMLVQLTFPFFAAFGLYAIGRLSASASIRRWCTMATVGYVTFWGWRFFHDEASKDFSPYTGPVLWMILTIASAALIRARLSASPPNLLRDPVLTAAFAVLISYAPAAALEPASLALYAEHRELILMLWCARGLLLVVGYALFTMVFYWTLPPRSSHGSLSSVA